MIRFCDIIHVTQIIDAPTTAPADPEGSARNLANAIIADFRATMTQLKCASSERLLREGVSMAQVHIMYTVERTGDMTMSHLADVLNVSDSNATGLVDRLEERGLVIRDRVPEDRRVVVVKATEAGRRLLGEVDALTDDILRSVLGRLDATQLLGVGQAIADLRAAVDVVVEAEQHRHPVSTTSPRSPASLRTADAANHHKEGIDH